MASLAMGASVALSLAGCTSSKANVSGEPGSVGCRQGIGGKVTIRAKNSRWDTSCIKVSGTSVTVTIVNQDRGLLHNFHVDGAPGTNKTELTPGPATQTLALKGLKPGTTYTYICDLHPDMIGQLEVQ